MEKYKMFQTTVQISICAQSHPKIPAILRRVLLGTPHFGRPIPRCLWRSTDHQPTLRDGIWVKPSALAETPKKGCAPGQGSPWNKSSGCGIPHSRDLVINKVIEHLLAMTIQTP